MKKEGFSILALRLCQNEMYFCAFRTLKHDDIAFFQSFPEPIVYLISCFLASNFCWMLSYIAWVIDYELLLIYVTRDSIYGFAAHNTLLLTI